MTNPGNGKNEVNGNPRSSSSSSKQEQSIADVIDALKDIVLTADSGAILAPDWQSGTLVGDQGRDTRRTRGNARAQTEIDNDNFSADGKVKGPNRSQRGNTTGFYGDTSSRGKNRKSEDNDGRIYATNNTRNHDTPDDYYMGNGGYRDSNKGTNTSRSGSTDNYMNNNNTSNTYDHSPSNENNVMDWSDNDEHPKHLTPSSTVPQQTPCNDITPSQDIDDDKGSVASKISAWHTLVDPKAKERADGVGTGQLHRKGRNYKPVDEKTVLEIQQRGKIIKRTKRSRENLGGKSQSLTKSGSFPRSLDRDNPSPKHDASLLNSPHSEPTAQRKQPAQRPSPSPPSSSPKPSSQAQPPPQQNAPEKDHPNIQPKLDNNTAAFREFPQGSPQKAQTITKPPQQSQYYRHQSSQDCLPYIPPEFDSTPYRKQPSPLPVNQRGDRNGNGYEDQEDGDQSSEATTEYYEESENEHILGGDRGDLLLTINVELSEGENPHAIYVRMGDDPLDLAREFCVKWDVTNEVVEPALAALIRDEKAKRLG